MTYGPLEVAENVGGPFTESELTALATLALQI